MIKIFMVTMETYGNKKVAKNVQNYKEITGNKNKQKSCNFFDYNLYDYFT